MLSPRRNKEYYYCRRCDFFFYRRSPEDPFAEVLTCPNCAAKINDTHEVATGKELPAIHRCVNNREVNEWRRRWMLQERRIPFRAAPSQYVKLPARFLTEVMPKLTPRQLAIIVLLLLYTDKSTGWASISIRTLCAYLTPPGRNTPLHNKTIQEALAGMRSTFVEVYSATEGKRVEVPLLQVVETQPRRYKVNMPDYSN